jgi:ABC-type Zn2+ transport system substrate-binding protein/surface adhesin
LTDEQAKPRSAEPTPELPESGADLAPQSQPLAHDEPREAHGHDHEPAVGDIPAEEHRSDAHAGGHVDEHDTAHAHDHDDPRVGPIDWPAWGYAVLGAALALVVIGAFWIAAYRPF